MEGWLDQWLWLDRYTVIIGYCDYLGTRPNTSHRQKIVTWT